MIVEVQDLHDTSWSWKPASPCRDASIEAAFRVHSIIWIRLSQPRKNTCYGYNRSKGECVRELRPKRLLASFAHPDDESFGAGGTLAKYAHQGVQVVLLCLTHGGAGIPGAESQRSRRHPNA